MAERPVLMFNSGIGGLSVLREARVLMPDRRFVYVADDAAFPYGDWEEEALHERIVGLFGDLLERFRPEIAVIPCNTASTLSLAALRASYPGTPFVGTVPAIKPAAERTRSGLVSVLATPGTVKRAIYARPDRSVGAKVRRASGRQHAAGATGRKLHARRLCR